MAKVVLFPQIASSLEWLKGHGDTILQYGWNVIAACILFFIGRVVSTLLSKGIEKILLRRRVDITVIHFFAAGVLLVTLRPFRAGNLVQIGAITGVVESVHIFSTTLLTADNKDVVIPNGKIIADSIVNYSRHPFRRIDLMISVGYDSRIAEVKRVILAVIDADRRIDRQRDTTVRLAELGASSLNFTVRVWVKNTHYWDTYYDLLENIKEALDEHHIAIPYPQMDIRVAGTVPTLS